MPKNPFTRPEFCLAEALSQPADTDSIHFALCSEIERFGIAEKKHNERIDPLVRCRTKKKKKKGHSSDFVIIPANLKHSNESQGDGPTLDATVGTCSSNFGHM